VRGERHRRGVAVLHDRRSHTATVGVKHIAPAVRHGEEGGKVAGRDGLRQTCTLAPFW